MFLASLTTVDKKEGSLDTFCAIPPKMVGIIAETAFLMPSEDSPSLAAIKLGGYTDNTGNADSNLKLSTQRANAAQAALVADGIEAPRVAAEGYGQEHPIATNDTPEGKAQNRRIDLRVTKK